MSKKRLVIYNIFSVTLLLIFVSLFSYLLFPLFNRFWIGLKDLGFSLGFFFKEIFQADWDVTPIVNESVYIDGFSFSFLPKDFAYLSKEFDIFFQNFVSEDFWKYYWASATPVLSNLSRVILIVLPFIFLFIFIVNIYMDDHDEAVGVVRKSYRNYLKFKKVLSNIKLNIKDFVNYFMDKSYYRIPLIVSCLFFTNIITIVLGFVSWYLYFFSSFDFSSIWIQITKLVTDISYMFTPYWLPMWIVIGVIVLRKLFLKIAEHRVYKTLDSNEKFVSTYCKISTLFVANMSAGKTKICTDLAITTEDMFFKDALEKMYKISWMFPGFDFRVYEMYLNGCFAARKIINLPTCNNFLEDHIVYKFSNDGDFVITEAEFYDVFRTYTLKEALIDYGKLYFLYTSPCSIITSNYAIRSGIFVYNPKHLISYVNDFRESSLAFYKNSRFSVILDQNNLRAYKKINKRIDYSKALDFGIYAIDEIGKERLNKVELEGIIKAVDEANQKNDGFNKSIKMSRHMATIDFEPFIKFFMTEQRMESVPADLRDLNDSILSINEIERKNLYPFFDFFDWWNSIFIDFFKNIFSRFRANRDDLTFIFQASKDCLHHFYRRITLIENRYNVDVYRMDLISSEGSKTGDCRYHMLLAKSHSKRYSTDAFSDVYNKRGLESLYGIRDLQAYKSEKATVDELKLQNSYFISDLYPEEKKIDEDDEYIEYKYQKKKNKKSKKRPSRVWVSEDELKG